MANKSAVYKNASRKEYTITEEKRDEYRRISHESRLAKLAAEKGLLPTIHPVNKPQLDPNSLMPQLQPSQLNCLSLFSGGGGLDLGFDKAGYSHCGSYELIPICKNTLLANRPSWSVYAGLDEGDVRNINWEQYIGNIDVLHGGPPCQPFSVAGEQKGEKDDRNMWGEFSRVVNTIKPKAFVAENVPGLLNPKFNGFIQKYILMPLQDYQIIQFELYAADFGVPQVRRRVFFVGFQSQQHFSNFRVPESTHSWQQGTNLEMHQTSLDLFDSQNEVKRTMGVRKALGLEEIGFDNLAPTIRSAFTGKRNTTSVLNSAASQKLWSEMQIWPNGVQLTREKASAFPAKADHFRLSVKDVGLIQGFPEDWNFSGAVYQILGQIGNSVVPPVAYQVAKSIASALKV
ncbi:MAG: DNA (cytosine-5-)-methyltransferase [Leptolyngbyaceae bacterium]|nr:DNA (cytosine-5-)-methyltransferase [Leptolyngbyaceae bacterium]